MTSNAQQDDEVLQFRQDNLILKSENSKLLAKANKYKTTKRRLKQVEHELYELQTLHNKLAESQLATKAHVDELVTYCQIQEDELSFSDDRLERIVRVMKQRHDRDSQLQSDTEFLKLQLKEMAEELRHKAIDSEAETQKIVQKLKDKNEKLKTVCVNQIKKIRSYEKKSAGNEETIRLKQENEQLRQEMQFTSRDLMVKIRELESQNELLSSSQSFGSLAGHLNASFDSDVLRCKTVRSVSPLNTSSIDLSYFRKNPEKEGQVVINKKVGQYIEKLKAKIARMMNKIQVLRKQRDYYRSHAYHNATK